MWMSILEAYNQPFAIALTLMLGIGLLEGLATVLGAGISGFLDNLLPEMDADFDLDLDVDGPDLSAQGPLVKFLGWLQVGRVPILVLLVVFLLGFGVSGLFVQSVAVTHAQGALPMPLAVVPALVFALFFTRFAGKGLARIIPKDETSAVSANTFVGKVAVVLQATARRGAPAQAKLKDTFGQVHYVMVEPDEDDHVLNPGTDVLLIKKSGAVFRAIENPNPALVDS